MTRSIYTPAEVAGGLVRSGIARLAGKYPFHARVLERFRPRADPQVGTMGVGFRDERLELVFRPEFVLGLTAEELGGVLLHEVMHVVLGHVTADPDAFPDHAARTIAEETTVNEFIREPLPGQPIVLAMFPRLPPNESTAERYRRLAGRVPRKWQARLPSPDSREERPIGAAPSPTPSKVSDDPGPESGADSAASASPGDAAGRTDGPNGTEPSGSSPGAGDRDAGQTGSGGAAGRDEQDGRVPQKSSDSGAEGSGNAPAGDGEADAENGATTSPERNNPGGTSGGGSGGSRTGGRGTSPCGKLGPHPDGDPPGEDCEGKAPGSPCGDTGGHGDGGDGSAETGAGAGTAAARSGPPQPGLVDTHARWPSSRVEREEFRAGLADVISDIVDTDVPVPTEIATALRDCGVVPGQGTYRLSGDSSGHLDWRQLLRRYVGRAMRVEPRYGRPSRRFPELVGIVPGRGRAEGDVSVVAVIDTSGSMSDPMLEAIAGELRRLGRHHTVHVVECDCVVRRTYRFRGHLEEVEGRGGTDFRPPLEKEFLRPLRPGVVIVFTDGDGPAPDRSPPVLVIWCLTPGGQQPVAWGRVVEMGPGEGSDGSA